MNSVSPGFTETDMLPIRLYGKLFKESGLKDNYSEFNKLPEASVMTLKSWAPTFTMRGKGTDAQAKPVEYFGLYEKQ